MPADPRAADLEALLEQIEKRGEALEAGLLAGRPILFRGFDMAEAERFRRASSALAGGRLRDYSGGASPRRAIGEAGGPVYTSTDYPPELALPLHNELSYSDAYPDRIYFGCLVAPSSGGATTLGDSRRILEALPATVRDAFEAKGVEYIRLLSAERGSGYAWQDAFRSDDPAELERRCRETGARWEWLADGFVRIVERRPAVAHHPSTGEAVWFNQASGFHPAALDPATHAALIRLHGDESRFRLNVRFGDGSPIPEETVRAVAAVLAREAVPHAWKRGDLLMLDNLLTAHGRAPFRGERSIAVALS